MKLLKKLTSFILSISLIIGLSMIPTSFDTYALPSYVLVINLEGNGYMVVPDPNGDGEISIADATLIVMYTNGGFGDATEDQLIQLDVTRNGIISYADAYFIMYLDSIRGGSI